MVPFQEALSPPMTPELYEQCELEMHVVISDGSWLRGGEACLFVLGVLGYHRTAAILGLRPLQWLVDMSYHIVARNRALFSRFLFTRD